MKALGFRAHGDLEQVEVLDLPEPAIRANEVLLEVHSAALNRLDLWVLEGWPGLRLKLPHVMGSDGAGIVRAVGPAVTGVAVGDRVAVNPTICNNPQDRFARLGRDNMCDDFAIIGEHTDGFFAEYTSVPARNLIPLPEHVSYETAAAAALVFVTAWHSLITRGALRAGESILIVGAGGGVNTASIQIAALSGARPVYVVGSSAQKLEHARDLGADVVINRQEDPDWSKAVYLATGKRGVDVVVDNVGAATFPTSLRCLRRGGRLLTVGNSSGPRLEIDNRLLFARHLSIIGSTMGTSAEFETVMDLVFAGRLRPVIDTIYPLSDGPTALRRLQASNVSGKLLLRIR